MLRYIFGRLLLFVPTLIGASLLIFAMLRIMPGDVAVLIAGGGEGTSLSPEAIQSIREELGLTRPLPEQYVTWLADIARLDFGHSLRDQSPVLQDVRSAFPVTLQLALMVAVVAFMIGVPLGVLAAVRRETWVDYLARVLGIAGLAMPVFWTGTLLILLMAYAFRWTPPLGFASLTSDPATNLSQMVFPTLVLGYYYAGVVSRMARSSMLEVLRHDYVRTAWAKGLRERGVVVRHALRNALLPIVTITGLQFAQMLGGTVIVEQVFSLPGMGKLLVDGIVWRDYPVVQSLVVIFAFWVLLSNLLVDLIYGWLDPRVRYA